MKEAEGGGVGGWLHASVDFGATLETSGQAATLPHNGSMGSLDMVAAGDLSGWNGVIIAPIRILPVSTSFKFIRRPTQRPYFYDTGQSAAKRQKVDVWRSRLWFLPMMY